MIVSVILAHPNKESFNHAIASTVVEALQKNGHDVNFHDLNEEKFDPILPFKEFPKDAHLPLEIEKHCKEISDADGIVIIHPNWWGQPPEESRKFSVIPCNSFGKIASLISVVFRTSIEKYSLSSLRARLRNVKVG
jgi:multimeric flavodoxin WrbA